MGKLFAELITGRKFNNYSVESCTSNSMRGFGRTGDRTRPGKDRQSTVGQAAGRDNSSRRSTKLRERWLEATIKVAHGQADEKGSFVWSFRTTMLQMLYFKCVLLRMTVRKADDDRSIVVVMGLARSESACDLVFFVCAK